MCYGGLHVYPSPPILLMILLLVHINMRQPAEIQILQVQDLPGEQAESLQVFAHWSKI